MIGCRNRPGSAMRWIAPLLLASLLVPPAAHAAEDVDVALVLVTDVSRSIDDSEFTLEKDGYATAFTSQAVLERHPGRPAGAIARRLCGVRQQLRSARPCWTGR